MELPNPYNIKNYKLLIIPPILLILLSLYFIPKIPAGLDLRGGTLITVQTNSSFDENALQASLTNKLGVHDISINKLQSPLGNKVEIEIEQNEKIAKGEQDMLDFYSKIDEVNTLQYDISRLTTDLQNGNLTQMERNDAQTTLADDQVKLPAATAGMNSAADSVISDYSFFVGKIDRSNATDTTSLESLLANASIAAKQNYSAEIMDVVKSNMKVDQFSLEDVSPSLSQFFISKTEEVVFWSFILTAVLVVIIFRSFVPSVAVMAGALSDIIIAMGGMGLFQVPLTLSSVAALLMLIGFSLDTDILLTTRVTRRTEGNPRDRAYGAMKTGLMMTGVAITSFMFLLVLSIITQISTYYEIAAVVVFGLVGDVVATWCTNAVIILWYTERKSGERK